MYLYEVHLYTKVYTLFDHKQIYNKFFYKKNYD